MKNEDQFEEILRDLVFDGKSPYRESDDRSTCGTATAILVSGYCIFPYSDAMRDRNNIRGGNNLNTLQGFPVSNTNISKTFGAVL